MKAAASNLLDALKELNLRWENCRENWNDSRSDEFAAQHLEDLASQVRHAAQQFEELDAVLRKMKKDCE